MEEEKFALVEKIIKDVHNIMARNAELSSFDIVPVDRNIQNKSPVLHEENCLGLESWCIKHVYMYCYSEVFSKFIKPKQKHFKVTVADADRLTKLLNMTLLINTDLSSLWNKRREMVERGLLDKVKELRFTMLVLSRKPKCNDAFSYRRWILDIILGVETTEQVLEDLISNELNICQRTADRSPNNYHSWNHRMWLINKLKNLKNYNFTTLLIKEYDFSQKWIPRHISDFSCFHYRQFCIKNIYNVNNGPFWKAIQDVANINLHSLFLRNIAAHLPKDATSFSNEDDLVSYSDDNLLTLLIGDDVRACGCGNKFLICRKLEILFHELILSDGLLQLYEHHETLWYHRRFIIHEILEMVYGYFSLARQEGVLVKVPCACQPEVKRQAKIVRYDSNCIYSSVLFNVLLNYEQRFVEERRLAGDNYADRHEKYLKFVKGFKITGH